jgi:hypothetical protein
MLIEVLIFFSLALSVQEGRRQQVLVVQSRCSTGYINWDGGMWSVGSEHIMTVPGTPSAALRCLLDPVFRYPVQVGCTEAIPGLIWANVLEIRFDPRFNKADLGETGMIEVSFFSDFRGHLPRNLKSMSATHVSLMLPELEHKDP